MPQPTQRLDLSLTYRHPTSPVHDSKFPTSARPSGVIAYDNFESGDFVSATGMSWQGSAFRSMAPESRAGGVGANSLLLHYFGGPTDSISEQRFDLDASYPELYFRWWLKVPDNFIHEEQPSASGQRS